MEKKAQNDSNKDEANDTKLLSYIELFSTKLERFLIFIAIVLIVISGIIFPLLNVLYGEFSNLMIDRQFPTDAPSTQTIFIAWFGGGEILQNASREERLRALETDSIAWAIGCSCFSFLQLLASTIALYLLNILATRQVTRIKLLFFKSIVCHDMTWFDTKMDGNVAGKAFSQLNQLEAGIGSVLGIFIYLVMVFFAGVGIAFFYGWQLTLAVLSVMPLPAVASYLVSKAQSKIAIKEAFAYSKAGNVAEETFSSFRTVVAFEGEKKELDRYASNLRTAKKCGVKRGIAAGIRNGILGCVVYFSYAVAFYYGVRLILISKENGDEEYTPAGVLIIFFGVLSGLTNIGFATNHLETFSVACGAATDVFRVIKSKSEISPCSDEGISDLECKGEIEFKNVHFQYPARPDVMVLRGLNLKIKAGEVVGIVGGSGEGKSTILQLVQRLYDPSQGEIYLDGQNIKTLSVPWLRQQMGVVGQEPLLFATTIGENIWFGLPTAKESEIMDAARKANAHDFISGLVDGYSTLIGQKGSTLSGGQKQRIAIARALVRNPKILLLDEATSALDSTSEKIVQAALDRASVGRTTLIVTHKLSTIANVHRIIVISNGVVAESGTEDELISQQGIYFRLLQSQVGKIPVSRRFQRQLPPQQQEDVDVLAAHNVRDDASTVQAGPRARFSLTVPFSVKVASEAITKESPEYKTASFCEMIGWNKHEWPFLTLGSFSAIVTGAALPVVCVLYGQLFGLLSLSDKQKILDGTDIYSFLMFLLGIICGISVFFQVYLLELAGMKFISRLRIKTFKSMMDQDMAWFDEERNRVGALCLRLTQDPSGVQRAFGNRIGIILQAFSTLTLGVVLSFYYDWKITLVTLTTVPFIFVGLYLEAVFLQKLSESSTRMAENASKIAVETVSNIKVVASLGIELYFIDKYTNAISEGKSYDKKKAWLSGFSYSIGQTAPFFGCALTFWYGGYLIVQEDLHYKYVLLVSELLIFGAWTLGQSVVFASSFAEAKAAAGRLKTLYLSKPSVLDGNLDTTPDVSSIVYSKVNFSYPTRPKVQILDDFNISISAGKSVAIVGPSGSGKSTVIQLLQRFYDPTSGVILMNSVSLKDYKISALRKTLGLVSQEPVLFDRSIAENIAYGDNSREVPMEEIIEAAKAANIHGFIISLPESYNTRLGTAGTQLSGGQKQRIAIARALVRRPQVLLLDEATSALDPQSEIVVQNTLDKASAGKMTITIAHRLSAVKNANEIYVLDKGVIRETGNHAQLMKLKGIYYNMHKGSEDDT